MDVQQVLLKDAIHNIFPGMSAVLSTILCMICLSMFQNISQHVERFVKKIRKLINYNKYIYTICYETAYKTSVYSTYILYYGVTRILSEHARSNNVMLEYNIPFYKKYHEGDIIYLPDYCTIDDVEFYYVKVQMNEGSDKLVPSAKHYITMKSYNKESIDKFIVKAIETYKADTDKLYNEKHIFRYMTNDTGRPVYISSENKSRVSFDNIVSKHVPFLKTKLDNFVNKVGEYHPDKNKIYRLNMLFYGPPGTGKTSYAKAIANYVNRHIIDVNLANIPDVDMLIRIFHEPDINIRNRSYYSIDQEEKVYIMEELEKTISGLLNNNKSNTLDFYSLVKLATNGDTISEEDSPKIKPSETSGTSETILPKKLKLYDLLTVFDGINELNSSLIISTANNIDDFPETLKRRFDVLIKIDYYDTNEVNEYLSRHYDIDVHKLEPKLQDVSGKCITPSVLEKMLHMDVTALIRYLNNVPSRD